MSSRTGPTIRGVTKDGRPRVYYGRKQKLGLPLPPEDRFLDVLGPGHVSIRTAAGMQLRSYAELGFDRLREIDLTLDALDAANEDWAGRLPHEPHFGFPPLRAVPDLAPLPVAVSDRKAA